MDVHGSGVFDSLELSWSIDPLLFSQPFVYHHTNVYMQKTSGIKLSDQEGTAES